jgi:hypothetical protein
MPTWAWVVIGVVLVLIIGCVGSVFALTYIGTQVATKAFSQIGSSLGSDFFVNIEAIGVVTEFYGDLDTGDYDSAHKLLSSDLASKYSSNDLKTKWEALKSAQGTITPGFPTGDKVDGNTVSMTQTLDSENGKTYDIVLKVEKSGSTWKIREASPGLIPEP